MKICSKCTKLKSLQEFSYAAKYKDNLQINCKACNKEYRRLNKEHKGLYQAEYYEKNKSELLAKQKARDALRKDAISKAKAAHYLNNKKQLAEIRKEWRKANPGTVNAAVAKRRYAKMKRTPGWLTIEDYKQIELFYKIASAMTKQLGIKFHVDHIIPLQGKEVSGLHVPTNLQILSAEENIRKSNKCE